MAYEEVVERRSSLARAALSGQPIADCAADAFSEGCFGSAGYGKTKELPEGAVRASLGCGNPVAVAELSAGETVLDLGSGGGIDVLLSARKVGPYGKVYGLDASVDMLELARRNTVEAGAANVDFLHGTIEDIPLPDSSVDVIISNCVINLSSDKPAVFAEAFRVLKPGGRLGISDVVAHDDADPGERAATEGRVGCTAGVLTVEEYRDLLLDFGFVAGNITPTSDHGGGVHSAIIRAGKPASSPGITIRPMRDADALQVLAIYQAGLDTGNASFETTTPAWEDFDQGKLYRLRYVAVDTDTDTDRVVGWIAASPVSSRCVYAGVVEHSVYVDPACQGRGIGRDLLNAFVSASEAAGIWTIQTGVFPENGPSLMLHQACGFRMVGTRERIGRHHGTWRDVLFLERRSTRT
ncbi:GNAT family N-acetyltransferase [Sphaerisporangium perillae]|uniref:GNAT family N-acetyltransferase n=1 Tax=Sphaerisporangium perillae TaxID=2935860 RepID=UPI00200FE0A8|nr:GNAT family N-acetyltransferase [Sphaerisporangium perillae]